MSASTLNFDRAESHIVARSADVSVTQRRIWISVLVPLALVGLLFAVFWRDAQPRMLLWLFVGYVLFGLLEKLSYGLAVLAYKRVVRKLAARVTELESELARDSNA